jgi:hypothetical protein
MPNIPSVPIDWASVNWLYVVLLAVFVFFSTLIGTFISFKRIFLGAVLSALLFAAAFVFWTYYPHGLPLPKSVTTKKTAVVPTAPPTAAAPSTPVKPADPVTTISPPPANSQ